MIRRVLRAIERSRVQASVYSHSVWGVTAICLKHMCHLKLRVELSRDVVTSGKRECIEEWKLRRRQWKRWTEHKLFPCCSAVNVIATICSRILSPPQQSKSRGSIRNHGSLNCFIVGIGHFNMAQNIPVNWLTKHAARRHQLLEQVCTLLFLLSS